MKISVRPPRLVGLVGLAILLSGTPIFGHHSFAAFDMSKTITLTGVVKEFQWLNPHSWIQMTVKDAAGNTAEWSIETGSPSSLVRQGWKSDHHNDAPAARRAARRFPGLGHIPRWHEVRRLADRFKIIAERTQQLY